MEWLFEQGSIDWNELSKLYRIAPLGDKKPDDLKFAFANSRYKCFVFDAGVLVGAGRAVADGIDCSYLCDVAIHPDFQGRGLGAAIVESSGNCRPATGRSSCMPTGQGRLLQEIRLSTYAHGDGDLSQSGARHPRGPDRGLTAYRSGGRRIGRQASR